MEEKIIKVGTFFSGIGSPEKALELLKRDNVINDYKCEFFCEIDKNAIKSYCAIHNIDPSLNLGSITDVVGENLPYCDLWVGGFPCQDISCAGKMKGFSFESSTRSSLGWEMIRLLREVEVKPKYVIFENVANITSKKFENTLNLFKKDLIDIGYNIYDKVLNAIDFGIPQTRKRYFLIAILDNDINFEFPEEKRTTLKFENFLDKLVDEKYYLTTDSYKYIDSNNIVFENIKNNNKLYEINLPKYHQGKCCGTDKECKFRQSARIFSSKGYAPTLTACNTADNCKVLVEEEYCEN